MAGPFRAPEQRLYAIKGDTLNDLSFVWESDGSPVDLTGYTGRFGVRPNFGEPFLVEASSAAGTLEIVAAEGRIGINVPAAGMVFDAGVYRWDLELTDPDGKKRTLIRGEFILQDEVA